MPYSYSMNPVALPHGSAATRQNDVRHEGDQFVRVSTTAVGIVGAPAVIDPHVAADGPSQFSQALCERRDAAGCFGIVRSQVHEHADSPHPLGLLRARR